MRKAIPTIIALAGLATVGACTRASTVQSAGDVATATPVNSNSLPTGSVVTVTLDQQVGTKNSKVGDTFSATVVDPIVASNGRTVVPAGTKVYGKVTGLQDSNNAGQKAAIRLDFERSTSTASSARSKRISRRPSCRRRGRTLGTRR